MGKTDFSAKKIALGGILSALAVICLFFAAVLPTTRLSLYALSSFFLSVIVIENGIKAGWVFYMATSLLSLAIIPDKLGVIPYIVFFGIYGLIKQYIERIGKYVPEYLLKYLFFNICFFAAFLFMAQFFNLSLTSSLPVWALIILFEIVFFIYDWVYSMFIGYYTSTIRPKLGL